MPDNQQVVDFGIEEEIEDMIERNCIDSTQREDDLALLEIIPTDNTTNKKLKTA